MKNRNIGLLGGGEEQVALANRLAAETQWEVYAMFLESPRLSPQVHAAVDFRDVLWLCRVLVLPDPACREGELLNAPLWPGRPVEAGQFSVSLIPHTAAVTVLGQKRQGDVVNLETDILG